MSKKHNFMGSERTLSGGKKGIHVKHNNPKKQKYIYYTISTPSTVHENSSQKRGGTTKAFHASVT